LILRRLAPQAFPKGKKDGEKPNRSWIAPLVYSCNPTWICYRFNAHNILF
jgi:hypothetical protein